MLTCEQARNHTISNAAAKPDAGRKAITVKQLPELVRQGPHRDPREGQHRQGISPETRTLRPARGRAADEHGQHSADVAKFHHDLRHIPYQANRCLEVLSTMFSLTEMWGLRPDGTNPRETEGIELPSAILAARLLILTGSQLNEIMTLKWAYFDLAEGVLHLLDSRSGAKPSGHWHRQKTGDALLELGATALIPDSQALSQDVQAQQANDHRC